MQKYLTVMMVTAIAVAVPVITMAFQRPTNCPDNKSAIEKEDFLYF